MSYIVWHPDTGTIMAADDSCLVPIEDLPADPEEWEDYFNNLGSYRAYEIVKGKELL